MQAAERQFWDEKAERWFYRDGLFGPLEEKTLMVIREEVVRVTEVLPERGIILNLGSGSNNEVYLGRNLSDRVVAMDFSKRMLTFNRARRKCVADANEILPLRDESVDVCVSIFLMRYLDEEKEIQLFAEIKRVLKPGGRFLIIDLSENNYQYQKRVFDVEKTSRNVVDLDFEEMRVVKILLRDEEIIPGVGSFISYDYTLGIISGNKRLKRVIEPQDEQEYLASEIDLQVKHGVNPCGAEYWDPTWD